MALAAHCYVLVGLCNLLLCDSILAVSSSSAGKDSCLGVTECVPVIDHTNGTAWLGCFFPEDLSVTKQSISLKRFPFVGTSKDNTSDYVFGCNWLRNGSIYCQGEQDYKLVGDVSHSLKVFIPEPKPKHEGYYSCVLVLKEASVAPIPCFLKFPVPEAPQDITYVSATANTVSVRWRKGKQESAFTNLPQVFRVRYKKTSTLDEVFRYDDVSPPNATEYQITGLEPSTWYEVSVSASNMFGWSPYQICNKTVHTQDLGRPASTEIFVGTAFGGFFVGAVLSAVVGILVYKYRSCKKPDSGPSVPDDGSSIPMNPARHS